MTILFLAGAGTQTLSQQEFVHLQTYGLLEIKSSGLSVAALSQRRALHTKKIIK